MNYKRYNSENKTNVTNVSMELIPLDEVLAKGTIFKELYEPYKIIPRKPVANSEQEELMHEIQTYAIAGIDLNLFLDVNPQNAEAITLYNMIKERGMEAVKTYEKRYGPLNLKSDSLKSVPWTWNLSSWPWEGCGQ